MKVRVYYNLQKHCWSVQKHISGKGWRLAGHMQRLALRNVRPVIQKHGQNRTRAEHKKYVHAFLEGDLRTDAWKATGSHRPITYRPMSMNAFQFVGTDQEFTQSPDVVLTEKTAYAV